jgi:hypothetical protein
MTKLADAKNYDITFLNIAARQLALRDTQITLQITPASPAQNC